MKCNNFSACHDPEVLNVDNSALYIQCKNCYATARIGKDLKGEPEHRAYSNWYKRDFVQPDHPLYYKYAGAKGMNVV